MREFICLLFQINYNVVAVLVVAVEHEKFWLRHRYCFSGKIAFSPALQKYPSDACLSFDRETIRDEALFSIHLNVGKISNRMPRLRFDYAIDSFAFVSFSAHSASFAVYTLSRWCRTFTTICFFSFFFQFFSSFFSIHNSKQSNKNAVIAYSQISIFLFHIHKCLGHWVSSVALAYQPTEHSKEIESQENSAHSIEWEPTNSYDFIYNIICSVFVAQAQASPPSSSSSNIDFECGKTKRNKKKCEFAVIRFTRSNGFEALSK